MASMGCAASAAADWTVNDTGNGSDLADNDVCEVTLGEGDCTLRAAIGESNNDASGLDTITFEAGLGTIVVSPHLLIEGPTTIDGNGSSGAGATVIDGNDASRVFAANPIFGDPTVTFEDLRIEDGATTGASAGGSGINTAMDTVVKNSVVTSNTVTGLNPGGAGSGAGISQALGDPDSLIIENSEISNNTITTGTESGLGAGIWTNGGLTLTDSTVSGNSIDGTGQDEEFGDLAEGGGLNINLDLTIVRSTISGNSVSGPALARGAGVSAVGNGVGPDEITNSTISGNTNSGTGDSAQGGGARVSDDVALTNVTLANNTAPDGADVYMNFGTATAQNSILASTGACGAVSGGFASATPGNNIDSGTSCGLGTTNGNQQSTDPLLIALAVNAPGTTATHALQPTSPAVNADAGCATALDTDQRGVDRPQPDPGACDVGAYELRYHTLTAGKDGTGTGTVTATGISCGGDCLEDLGEGSHVLTATPAAGSDFASWSGCDNVSGEQCTVNLNSDRLVTASFAVEPPPPPGGGSTTPTKKCKKGQKLKKGKCVKKKRKKR